MSTERENDADVLIRVEKVAEFYDVEPKTVERWASAGRIPAPVVKQKKFTRWSRNAIVEHVNLLKSEATCEAAS